MLRSWSNSSSSNFIQYYLSFDSWDTSNHTTNMIFPWLASSPLPLSSQVRPSLGALTWSFAKKTWLCCGLGYVFCEVHTMKGKHSGWTSRNWMSCKNYDCHGNLDISELEHHHFEFFFVANHWAQMGRGFAKCNGLEGIIINQLVAWMEKWRYPKFAAITVSGYFCRSYGTSQSL